MTANCHPNPESLASVTSGLGTDPREPLAGIQIDQSNTVAAQSTQFAFPDPEAETGSIVPIVTVPAPLSWHQSDQNSWVPPSLKPLDTQQLTDISPQGIAIRLHDQLRRLFGGFAYDAGSFWVWDGQVWRSVPKYWMESAVAQFHNRTTQAVADNCKRRDQAPKSGDVFDANSRSVKGVIDRLRSIVQAEQRLALGVSLFDNAPGLAAFTNATLVINRSSRVVSELENAPEHLALHSYPFDWERGLKPHWFLRILREDWLRGLPAKEVEQRISVLRAFAGHAMLGSQRHTGKHCALLLYGRGGDGKSTFYSLIRACLPSDAHCSIGPGEMSSGAGGGELARAALFGKSANIVDDLSALPIANLAHWKTITSFGQIQARRIGGDPFTFQSQATQLFAANELPKVTDTTHGFVRRWRIIEFPNRIDSQHFDGALVDNLLAHEQREFVCWCIEEALDMLASGEDFAQPECSQRWMSAWVTKGDSVSEFVTQATVDAGPTKAAWTPFAELYSAYVGWMKFIYDQRARAGTPVSKQAFACSMAKLPGVRRDTRGHHKTHVVSRRVTNHAR